MKYLILLKLPGVALVVLFTAARVIAQDLGSADSQSPSISAQNTHTDTWAHPELSTNDGWAGDMLWIVALGFFLPAAIIGPFIRKRVAAELPELHDSEEADALLRNNEVSMMNDE